MAASSLAVTVSTRVWIVLATHDLRTRHTVTKRPLATDTARGRCIPALGRVAAGGVGDFACRPLVVGAACAVVWARAVTLALDAGGRADGVAAVRAVVPLSTRAVVWCNALTLPGNAALRTDSCGAPLVAPSRVTVTMRPPRVDAACPVDTSRHLGRLRKRTFWVATVLSCPAFMARACGTGPGRVRIKDTVAIEAALRTEEGPTSFSLPVRQTFTSATATGRASAVTASMPVTGDRRALPPGR